MDQHLVWLLILLVVGVVVSNLMVLKYTSKFKWPSKQTPDEKSSSGGSIKTDDKTDS